jgi:hypothetical protein
MRLDRNITIIKVGGLVGSSSLMTNMVIFNDPIYLYLALGGGIVSVGGLIHDVVEYSRVEGKHKVFWEMIKALFLGFVLTPMLFMFYLHAGDKVFSGVLKHIFDIELNGISGMLNSFWFLGAILTSWYVLPLWTYIVSKLQKREKRDD